MRRASAAAGATSAGAFWRRVRTRRAGDRDPFFVFADAPHRRPQSRRPRRAAARLSLSQPVPRRPDRRAGAEPADARRNHRRGRRRLGDRRDRFDHHRSGKAAAARARRKLGIADESRPSLEFSINPERVGPVLRRLVSPTRTRARIYDRDGYLLLDSRALTARANILRLDLPPPATRREIGSTAFGRR